MTSIHITAFAASAISHGGVKRSNQLTAMASEKGRVVIYPFSADSEFAFFSQSFTGLLFGIFNWFLFARFFRWRRFKSVFLEAVWIHGIIALYRPDKAYIETCGERNILACQIFAFLGISYVVYPHNIEFMVPGQPLKIFRSKIMALAIELDSYRKAVNVLTISDFDTSVLRCFGLESVETYPYSPITADSLWCQQIRVARETSNKRGILILGSVGNYPTRKGMVSLLELIRSHGCHYKFQLAGYCTEELREIAPPCVDVCGTVSIENLRELMVGCEALLVFQPPTSGMLTRMIDADLAGVPVYVMGGYVQAAMLGSPRIRSISSLEELWATLKSDLARANGLQ